MYHGIYFQDSWRVNRRLTLHLGLRYELQQARTERYNRQNNFDFTIANPLAQQTGLPLKGGLVFNDSSNRGAWQTDKMNLAPRFGLAYKITDKLVFRGGYGSRPESKDATERAKSIAIEIRWIFPVRGNDGLSSNDECM